MTGENGHCRPRFDWNRELRTTPEIGKIVIPVKAGIQFFHGIPDSRLRRNERGIFKGLEL